jgi:hypothetical protein
MRTCLAVAIALLAFPAAASAGEVVVELDEGEVINVTYRAAPGEANVVSFTSDGTTVAIRDDGAPVRTQSSACRADGEHATTCAVTTSASYSVDLGDGDDRLVFDGVDAGLLGGPGNDEITSRRTRGGKFAMSGGAGDDHLASGATGEELYGDGGNDVLEGGDGSDRLDGGTGTDRIDGGPGEFDSVDYVNRRSGVRVDLAAGTAGGAGEADTVAGVESALTGAGDDVLIGDDAGNELFSGTGRDRIDARGGDDQIATVGAGGSIGCGAGRDTAMPAAGDTVVAADCELASGEDMVPARAQPVLRGGAAVVAVRIVERRQTRGSVVLRAGPRGPVIGTGDAGPGFRRSALARVRVPLTRAGRAYLRRPSGKLLTVGVRLRDADGRFSDSWTIRLR